MVFFFLNNFVDTLEEALCLIRTSLNSPQMDVEGSHYDQNITHLIVVMGASVIIYFFFTLSFHCFIENVFNYLKFYRVI